MVEATTTAPQRLEQFSRASFPRELYHHDKTMTTINTSNTTTHNETVLVTLLLIVGPLTILCLACLAFGLPIDLPFQFNNKDNTMTEMALVMYILAGLYHAFFTH